MEHIGLKAFYEVCDYFRLFSSPIPVNTHYCDHFISGGRHPQLNYIYNLRLDNLPELTNEEILNFYGINSEFIEVRNF